ncbi:MAG: esterase/lipase family protein [Lysobacteraceae bacterium]
MIDALRGTSRLAVDAVTGVTDIAEALHAAILSLAPVAGPPGPARAGGLSGAVYGTVRGVARGVGRGLDLALAPLAASRPPSSPGSGHEALRAALNGVLGDHLEATGNPLAIPMRLRQRGVALDLGRRALARTLVSPGPRPLILLHGLCMNDLQWRRDGLDHGAAMAHSLGLTPVHLHYNTGRGIQANAAELSEMIQALVHAWPTRIQDITLLGHSMGGLVAHAASSHALHAGHGWVDQPGRCITLGTPHQGAPLEQAGEWVSGLLGRSPYLAPFQRLGEVRSTGIKDLREGVDPGTRDALSVIGDRLHLIAAVRAGRPAGGARPRGGDGLVPVGSALARAAGNRPGLDLPASRRHVVWNTTHLGLLSSADVQARLRHWLSLPASGGARRHARPRAPG